MFRGVGIWVLISIGTCKKVLHRCVLVASLGFMGPQARSPDTEPPKGLHGLPEFEVYLLTPPDSPSSPFPRSCHLPFHVPCCFPFDSPVWR